MFDWLRRLFYHHPSQEESDCRCLQNKQCPNCHSHTLLESKLSSGMNIDLLCAHCMEEFNVAVFGGLVFSVQRHGRVTPERARQYWRL